MLCLGRLVEEKVPTELVEDESKQALRTVGVVGAGESGRYSIRLKDTADILNTRASPSSKRRQQVHP